MSRVDRATQIIRAAPETIYGALVDPQAMTQWRPPAGMTGEVLSFDARPGGILRMALHYRDPAIGGKTGAGSDIFESRFVELVPEKRVVEAIDFTSDDPAFSGTMTVTTTLEKGPEGTQVTIACSNVPSGIHQQDHLTGMTSTLENLARYCAKQA